MLIIKGQENPDFKLPACPFDFRIFRLLCPAGPEIAVNLSHEMSKVKFQIFLHNTVYFVEKGLHSICLALWVEILCCSNQ